MALAEWKKEAKCFDAAHLDGQDFITFGFEGKGRQAPTEIEKLRKICRTCTVWKECIDFALEKDAQYGMWGGVIFTRPRNRGRPEMRRKIEFEYICRNERL